MPRPPDCEANPTGPAMGASGAKVAFIETAGLVLMIPKQLGPTRRMPCPWASVARARWVSVPPAPLSANPAVITTSEDTPLAPHSSTA